jgi:CRP-like cAMP-binding protein
VEPGLSIIEKTMILVESPFFKGVTTEETARVAARLSELHFQEAEPVPYGDGIFLVLEGAVELVLGNQVVRTVVRGDGFGLGSALGVEELSEYSGRARGHTHCLFMTREDFQEVLVEHPEVTVALLRQMFLNNLELHHEVLRLSGGPSTPGAATDGPSEGRG